MAKKGKNADVIQWMSRYIKQQKLVTMINHEMDVLNIERARLKSPEISDMPRGSGSNEGLEKYIIAIEGQWNLLNKAMEEAAEIREEISEAIFAITDETLVCVLRYRYLLDWKWDRIAKELNFNEEYVRCDLHGQALQKIKVPTKPNMNM